MSPWSQHFDKKTKSQQSNFGTQFYISIYIYIPATLLLKNMSETESVYEQEYDSDSTPEVNVPNVPRRYHKGRKSGQHVREEPTSLAQLQACPLAMDCFRCQSCYQYCEMISQTQHHQELVHLFVLNLQDGHVNLAGVDFTLSPDTVA